MFLSTLFGIANQPYESRQVAEKIMPEENNGIGVSTAFADDIELFETALLDANGAHPVERYTTKKKAVAGHNRWRQLSASLKLQRVIELGLEDLGVPNNEIKLRRVRCLKSSK